MKFENACWGAKRMRDDHRTASTLVNSAGILKKTGWATEPHPKPAAFKKIATQRWLPALSAHGLA